MSAAVDPAHFGHVGAKLQPAEGECRVCSKPLFVLVDSRGSKYILKVAEPALMAAEQAAYRLRKLGQRPAVAARIVELDIDGVGHTRGLLKPFIEFDSQRELGPDTTAWSELQRRVLLREHVWDWFLDNLDAHTGQFALIGPEGYPLNIDWDRAFADEGTSEFSRFAKYRVALPNARTFLYADFVEGKIELDLRVLAREASHIRRLPEREVKQIVTEYARVRFDDGASAQAFVRRVLMRKRSVEGEVAHFIRELRKERRAITGASAVGLWHDPRALALVIWNHSQVVLHALQRSAVGELGRRVLTRSRAKSAGVPSELNVPAREADQPAKPVKEDTRTATGTPPRADTPPATT